MSICYLRILLPVPATSYFLIRCSTIVKLQELQQYHGWVLTVKVVGAKYHLGIWNPLSCRSIHKKDLFIKNHTLSDYITHYFLKVFMDPPFINWCNARKEEVADRRIIRFIAPTIRYNFRNLSTYLAAWSYTLSYLPAT